MKEAMPSKDMDMGKVSPRKRMAMGKSGTSFGNKSYADVQASKPHPDRNMTHEPMGDSDRGIGMPVGGGKGMHPMQAAPKHS